MGEDAAVLAGRTGEERIAEDSGLVSLSAR